MTEVNSLATVVKSQGAKLRPKRISSELVNLPSEGHKEESPRLGVNGNVEVPVHQTDAVHPHSWKKSRSDGLC